MALMSDEMSPPAKMEPETLPKAEPLKMRNRQRTSSTNRHEFRDRMSNHKLDKDTEDVEEEEDQEKVESKKPVAEALRSPAPPMDHMDEYYYYDDEPPARPPVRPPPTTTKPPSKYPNFPPAKKPVSKYEDKYKHKQPSPSKHYNHHKKETHDYKHRKPSSNSFKSSYNIESTIKRLQDIKKSQLERKGA